MKHLSLKSLVVVMLVCAPLFASNAFARIIYDSVVNKAINNNNTQSMRTTTNPPASDEYFGNVNALPLSPEIMSTFNPGNSTGVSANNPNSDVVELNVEYEIQQ